jgi:hypothetical protein
MLINDLKEPSVIRSDMLASPTIPALMWAGNEEELVPDSRAELSPAQMVEDKLTGMLKGDGLVVSQLRFKKLIGQRG